MKEELAKWYHKVFIFFGKTFHRYHKLNYGGSKKLQLMAELINETFLNVVSDSKLAAGCRKSNSARSETWQKFFKVLK